MIFERLLPILTCSLSMTVISLIFIILSLLLKNRQSPKFRYYSWIVILVGFLTPVKPSFGGSLIEIETASPALNTVSTVPASSSSLAENAVFALWIAGSLIFFAANIFRHIHFCRAVKQVEKPVTSDKTGTFAEICAQTGMKKKVKISIVPGIATPMITGFFRPKILMPNRKFERDELRLILKHELTHFKRGDLWFKLLFIFARSIHWFNPIFILISKYFETECELSCDESVLKHENRENKKLYCRSIIDSASSNRNGMFSTPVTAANLSGSKKDIKSRIWFILSRGQRSGFTAVLALILLMTICSGAFISVRLSAKAASKLYDTTYFSNETETAEYITGGQTEENYTNSPAHGRITAVPYADEVPTTLSRQVTDSVHTETYPPSTVPAMP